MLDGIAFVMGSWLIVILICFLVVRSVNSLLNRRNVKRRVSRVLASYIVYVLVHLQRKRQFFSG